MGAICGETKIQCLGWISEAIAMKFAKLWFGRELVAAWHFVVLKAQVAHYPHYTRMSKYLVMAGSSNDKVGAA